MDCSELEKWLFRIGEMVASNHGNHTVKARDVHIGMNKNKVLFILQTSKTHGRNNFPQSIKISSVGGCVYRGVFCPFAILRQFLSVRPNYVSDEEHFFCFRDRTPVTQYHFRSTLKNMLKLSGVNHCAYSSHSLRAGRSILSILKHTLT